MNKPKSIFSLARFISGVFMILALLWLTAGTPFIYAAQKAAKETSQKNCDKETGGEKHPFSNTTEEKSETCCNSLSEYLHEIHTLNHPVALIKKYTKCNPSALYFAYHPELISPPPEV